MKVLVIGSGGREHAMAWKLSQSIKVSAIFIAPGNGGTYLNPKFKNIDLTDINLLSDFAIKEKIDLTVVGPELPLSKGIVDLFRFKNLNIFGPTQKAAQLEALRILPKTSCIGTTFLLQNIEHLKCQMKHINILLSMAHPL